MSKKKPPSGFHSPFADAADRLKKTLEEAAPAPRPAAPPPAPIPGPPASGDRLWEDAISGVRPLAAAAPVRHPGASRPRPASGRPRARARATTPRPTPRWPPGRGRGPVRAHRPGRPGARRSTRRLLKKLRGGDYPIEARVDLHGLTVGEAEATVVRFLTESRKHKRRAVLVIHGRGLNSEAGPVLKEALREWLSGGRLARGVLAFSLAQPADGGEGATYVLLRKLTS